MDDEESKKDETQNENPSPKNERATQNRVMLRHLPVCSATKDSAADGKNQVANILIFTKYISTIWSIVFFFSILPFRYWFNGKFIDGLNLRVVRLKSNNREACFKKDLLNAMFERVGGGLIKIKMSAKLKLLILLECSKLKRASFSEDTFWTLRSPKEVGVFCRSSVAAQFWHCYSHHRQDLSWCYCGAV